MLIKRTIASQIKAKLYKGKAIIIYGPRQVGKTTLVRQLQAEVPDSLYLNCDEPDIRAKLENKTSTELVAFIGPKRLVVVDEGQRVRNIGLTLKLLVDAYPQMQIVATGSSSFDLANQIAEPLTGRAYEFHLFPLSVREISSVHDRLTLERLKDRWLIYGNYPEVITRPAEAEEIVKNIATNYLYKDALQFQVLKKTEVMEKLLQALALQVGQQVSYTELANLLAIDSQTVEKYIEILQQAFVIFKLPPFSRNLRKELAKTRKIYFWDNGIRNALINNFNPVSLRGDVGVLWENFLIAQRIMTIVNERRSFNRYFWRTWDKAEIDYVEEVGGNLAAFEIKWQGGKQKPPKAWRETYSQAAFKVINSQNWLEFLG